MISREDIISVLSPFNFWGKDQETGILRREYLKDLRSLSLAKHKIVAITGIRRAGKTMLLKQFLHEQMGHGLKKEQTLYVNFEDPQLDPYLSLQLLEEIYSAYKAYIAKDAAECYLILDEIQNIERWEKWARIKQELRDNIKIFITGSSSKLLSSELSTVLTGRTLKLNVFPLSFSEFLSFKNLRVQGKKDVLIHKEKIRTLLKEYLDYGGFPEVVLEREDLKSLLLKDYFEGIISRDILKRHSIRDVNLVRVTAELAINNFASLTSANKLRKMLVDIVKKKISPNSVVNLLTYFEDAQLIFQIPLLSYKIKEQKLYPKKTYCIDTGLINAVGVRFREKMGALYENIVAIELKRRGREIYYWKSSSKKEVDFVIKEGFKVKELVNVCYDFSNEETQKRELSGLLGAMKEFKLNKGLIITENHEGEELFDGKLIRSIPLWKWLLA